MWEPMPIIPVSQEAEAGDYKSGTAWIIHIRSPCLKLQTKTNKISNSFNSY